MIQQLCAVLHVSLVELLDGRNGVKGYDEQTMLALLHRTQELEKQKIILYGLVLIVLGIAGGALANTTGGSDIQSFVSGLLMKLICCRNSFWYKWGDTWTIPLKELSIILLIVVLSAIVAVYGPIKRIHNMSIVDTISAQ